MCKENNNHKTNNRMTIRHNPAKGRALLKYSSPRMELSLIDYDCLIAQSLVEDPEDGGDWIWED